MQFFERRSGEIGSGNCRTSTKLPETSRWIRIPSIVASGRLRGSAISCTCEKYTRYRYRKWEHQSRCSSGGEKKMIRTFMRQVLSAILSFLLVFTTGSMDAVAQQPAPAGSTEASGQGAPLSADQLEQLVAPIALY